jgi:membrane protein DedA with SNARE-associated domain/membrane-associated phospholipid phosphatase
VRLVRESRRWIIRVAIAAAIVAFFVFRDQLPSVNLDHLIRDAADALGAWTYLLVGALAFLETGAFVGLVAPGEFTVILGGAVAGQGQASLPLMIAVTWTCAFAGDSVSFLLGSRLGRGFLVRHGERFRITEPRLARVDGYFQRHGGKTILVGRFIGLVRALAPFIAGSSKMRYRAFAPYSILGTGLWATGLILAGYFASRSIDRVTHYISQGLLAFALVVGLVVAGTWLVRTLRVPANRKAAVDWMEKRRPLRPLLALGRRLRPQAQFVWARLTPGGLGLELTSLLAVLAVGLFVLIAYWSIVSGDPGPTPGDRTAQDVADSLQVGWLTAVAKAITTLGASYVAFPLAALAAIALAVTRRPAELVVLVVGMVLTAVLAHDIKVWTERPRPPDGLVSAHGFAFPSAHAAYATLYTWLAVTVAVRVVPGIARGGLVIAAGIAITALIGLSRVYLGVHWLSDVSGGWALGASCFSAAAAVALVVSHIRHNAPADDRDGDSAEGRGSSGGHA